MKDSYGCFTTVLNWEVFNGLKISDAIYIYLDICSFYKKPFFFFFNIATLGKHELLKNICLMACWLQIQQHHSSHDVLKK